MSSKNSKKQEKNDYVISSVIEKKEKNSGLIFFLIVLIVILSILLCYFAFFKRNNVEVECSSVSIKEVEVEPKHQYINYQGFKFKMPLDWDFVSKDNNYEISNKEENLFISLNSLPISYEEFLTSTYQNIFLEEIQTSGNIKIENSVNEKNYYLMEGTNNSYKYMIVVIGNENKVVLVNTQFVDMVSYDKMKKSIIDFSLSALK